MNPQLERIAYPKYLMAVTDIQSLIQGVNSLLLSYLKLKTKFIFSKNLQGNEIIYV
jgi:hypothetical protein